MNLSSYFPGAHTDLELSACANGDAALLRALAPLLSVPPSPTFNIVVFGGSYPKGCDCDSPLFPLPELWKNHCSKDCSWAGRLTDYLRAVFPRTTFTHTDLTVPASGITTTVATLQDLLVAAGGDRGLLLVDHTANDVVLNTPQRELVAAYEYLIQSIEAQAPHLRLVLVAACPAWCAAANTVVSAAAAAHGVAHISYNAFVSAALALARVESASQLSQDTYFKFPEGTPHPTWRVHILVARLVGRCMARSWGLACGGGRGDAGAGVGIAEQDELAAMATCSNAPWGNYNALRATTGGVSGTPLVSSGLWVLEEDRAGKPGWIAHSPGAELRFHGRFVAGRIVIAYLRSFEGLAKVSVSVLGIDSPPVILDGLWERGSAADVAAVSQLDVLHINVSHVWPLAPKGVDVDVVFRVIPVNDVSKFKVVVVQVC